MATKNEGVLGWSLLIVSMIAIFFIALSTVLFSNRHTDALEETNQQEYIDGLKKQITDYQTSLEEYRTTDDRATVQTLSDIIRIAGDQEHTFHNNALRRIRGYATDHATYFYGTPKQREKLLSTYCKPVPFKDYEYSYDSYPIENIDNGRALEPDDIVNDCSLAGKIANCLKDGDIEYARYCFASHTADMLYTSIIN